MEFDLPADGKQPEQSGAIERWQNGESSKTVTSVGTAKRTLLQVEGKVYSSSEGGAIPDAVEDLQEAVLHPGPSEEALDGAQPELRKQAFGKTTLTCIMLSQQMRKGTLAPLGLFPTYCLSDSGSIVASYNFGSRTVVATSFGKFLEHTVFTGVSVMQGPRVLARGKITELKTYSPQPGDFEISPELSATAASVRISGGLMAKSILHQDQPVYPHSARAAGVEGTVVLAAVIGQDGHVEFLRPVSTPDPDLAISALDAVRNWRYKPYLLNGTPVRIKTTITVNFKLR